MVTHTRIPVIGGHLAYDAHEGDVIATGATLDQAIASALSNRPDLDSSRIAAFPCTAARVEEGGVEGLTVIQGVAVSQAEAEAYDWTDEVEAEG